MPRVHLKASDVLIGQPIKWDVFDHQGDLILAKGVMIEDEAQKHALLKRRGYRELSADLVNPALDSARREGRGEAAQKQDKPREVELLFDETRIQPGDPLQLQGSQDTDRFSVRLIGYLKGKSLVATNPTVEGAPLYLKDGQAFVVRGFSGKLAFAFPATVLGTAVKPYPHVHLSYPVGVKGLRVRKGERVKMHAIAAFDLDTGARGSGVVVNLSNGGAMLLSRSPDLILGAALSLKFKLSLGPAEYVLDLPGHVRSSQPYEETGEFGLAFGIQFGEISPEDNLVITAFVSQQLAENRVS